ncbi:MAG TPA: DNA-processing protein DprA [Burkholderiaceae bacterium]|nr:DNA-processing protein DprA [Burkholderiaceae bacterium]
MPLSDCERDELAALLRLAHTDGIGPIRSRALRERFGCATRAAAAPRAELAGLIGAGLADALLRPDPRRDRAVEQALDWARHPDHHLLPLADPHYPSALAQAPDAPPLLYLIGDPAALAQRTLAIVGARNASAGGVEHAQAFARALAAIGWTIVSGLARGIDAAAHQGALAAGGVTVAVMGTGADRIYPSRHAPLAQRIVADGGALLTELPLGTAPERRNFPCRNRLIAGLSEGVLVVEAAIHSGSMSTVEHALDYGREVFAIPGSIDSPLARGCNRLIKQGAKLVDGIDDLLDELCGAASGGASPHRRSGSDAARADCGAAAALQPDPALLRAVGFDPVLPETLAQRLQIGIGEVAARLLDLELSGWVERMSDGRIVRRTRARDARSPAT